MNYRIAESREEKEKLYYSCEGEFAEEVINRIRENRSEDKMFRKAIFIGAWDNDIPVAYCAVYANDMESYIAFITMIAVKKEYRGRQIGSLILSLCEKVCEGKQMREIRLEVYSDNYPAIKFYVQNGYIFSGMCLEKSMFFSKIL